MSILLIAVTQRLSHPPWVITAQSSALSLFNRDMSGRRLLDAIQLLNVSKTVADRHLAIRQHQLDVYTRTSSLSKGVKSQVDGLILTAQAAAALARRFDESSSPPPNAPSSATVAPGASAASPGPQTAAKSNAPAPDDARKLQRKAEFQVPASAAQYTGTEKPSALDVSQQQDVFYEPSRQSAPDLSALPRVKLPKAAGDVQTGGGEGLNADVFHSAAAPERPAAEEQEPSAEMMEGLFHSPRVSRMLSGKPAPKRDWLPADKTVARPSATTATPASPAQEVKKEDTEELEKLGASIAEDVVPTAEVMAEEKQVPYQMMESRVPSSRIGRLWQYGGLATSMAFGAVSETVRRAAGGQENGSIMFSAGNMERMVAKLSKMRGAALKLGQMLSIQGMHCRPHPQVLIG